MSVPKGVKTSPVWAMRMGCAESLARPKIATIEKMNARVQIKTEPGIAPPKARPILKEKCASIVLTRWPLVRLKSNAKKIPNAATIRRNAMGGMFVAPYREKST